MMSRFFQVLFAATLCISLSAHNADVTTNLLAYMSELLEQNTLDDKNLHKLIACAKEHKTCNPIDACQADISTVHSVAFRVINSLLEDNIDSARVLAWAKKNLKIQEETRKEQKQTREDTKSLFGKLRHASIAVGYYHSCAIEKNGGVVCWGYHWATVPQNLSNVIHISAGNRHTCALSVTGKVTCWGNYSYEKAVVPAELSEVLTLTSGDMHTCALLCDGAVRCWGDDHIFGQSTVPFGLDDASDIAAFGASSCALRLGGSVTCWGTMNYKSYLHDILTLENAEITARLLKCSVSKIGNLGCWKENTSGQTNTPAGLSEITEIASGNRHTCAVLLDGSVRCWGTYDYGQTDVPEGLRVRLPSSGSTP